jgi:hypothetical protein
MMTAKKESSATISSSFPTKSFVVMIITKIPESGMEKL